jgi:hypothetical protein
LAWNGKLFVAVGAGGVILTSPDGAGWSIHPSRVGNALHSVAWNGKQFVAVGDVGTVLVSPDGISWMSCNSGTNYDLHAIAWDGKELVATVADGRSNLPTGEVTRFPNSGTDFLTSPDGVAWTQRASVKRGSWDNAQSDIISNLIWTGTQFIGVGSCGLVTSPDGYNWTLQDKIPAGSFYAVASNGTRNVAVGSFGAIISTQPAAQASSH